jgi:putative transposase
MRRNKLAIFPHRVWATWDRLPLIDAASERRLYHEIESEALKMRCIVLALNGMPDHELTATCSTGSTFRQATLLPQWT